MGRLREEEGLSYPKIAERLGRTTSGVRYCLDQRVQKLGKNYQWVRRHLTDGKWEREKRRLDQLRRIHAGFCRYCSKPHVTKHYCQEHQDKETARIKAYRRKNVVLGFCLRCSRLRINKQYCEVHRKRQIANTRRWQKEHRMKRQQQGLCSECPQPSINSRYCKEHNDRANELQRARRKLTNGS